MSATYLTKVLAVILAIILMFMWPIYSTFEKQDDLSQIVVLNSVSSFVDAVRDKGFITPTMYNDFVRSVEATGNTYDVQMEHLHKRYDPIYDDAGTFLGDYAVNYEGFYNAQINDKIFPRNSPDPIESSSRIYKLAAGDFFTVTVKNTNRTLATLIGDFLTGTAGMPNGKIVVPYGGMVLNEDY